MNAVLTSQRAVLFGEYEHLVGILTEPTVDRPDRTAVLMLNAGMLNSAGPFRLHVDLASALRDVGLYSFRFDLSGIGESLAVANPGTSLERAARGVSAAMDYMQMEHGIHRFALFGLCSGADDALFSALQDDRIRGIFAMDGLGYRTRRYYLQRVFSNYLPKLGNARIRSEWIARVLGISKGDSRPETLQLEDDIREFPSQADALTQLRQLMARGVRMHFHYTGGVDAYYNYSNQFNDMFPQLRAEINSPQPLLSHSFSPESDHVGYLCEHRATMIELATRKLTQFAL
jgi:hypothetical protein